MNKYRCPACDKYLSTESVPLKVGDKVSFTKVIGNGRTIRMTSVKGIVQDDDKKNDLVRLRYRGEFLLLPRSRVTPIEAPNSLTVAMHGTCKCPKKETHHE